MADKLESQKVAISDSQDTLLLAVSIPYPILPPQTLIEINDIGK